MDEYPNRKRGFFYLRAQTHATVHEYKLFHEIFQSFFNTMSLFFSINLLIKINSNVCKFVD